MGHVSVVCLSVSFNPKTQPHLKDLADPTLRKTVYFWLGWDANSALRVDFKHVATSFLWGIVFVGRF